MLRVQGSIACGVQLPAAFKVQLPAAFKGSRFNCLRRSIAYGVPASFLAVTVQGFNVWGVQGFKCLKSLKSFVFMIYGLELRIWYLEFGIYDLGLGL